LELFAEDHLANSRRPKCRSAYDALVREANEFHQDSH